MPKPGFFDVSEVVCTGYHKQEDTSWWVVLVECRLTDEYCRVHPVSDEVKICWQRGSGHHVEANAIAILGQHRYGPFSGRSHGHPTSEARSSLRDAAVEYLKDNGITPESQGI